MGDTNNKSLTKNSFFYLLYNILNVGFPFITGIYVAKVIPVDFVGRVSYAQNIVQYFAILSFLGIPTYGLREISKLRNDTNEKNKVFSELMIINAISTTFFSIAYFVVVFLYFRNHLLLYTIVGFSVIINYLNISWLYEGLEEYKYISIRNIVFKTICLVLLFLLVKDPNDYILYAGITVFGVAGNYFVNVLYAPKFVKFSWRNLNLKRHFKPIMLLVVVNLAIEIYTLVDTTMIGVFCEERFVAYYSYGSKINKILIQIILSFTMVIVPRIAFHYHKGNMDEFNKILSTTFKIICLIGIPFIIGIYFCSDYAVTLVYGDAYKRSAQVLKILSLAIVFSPIGYLLGSRVMLVTNNESKMPICVGTGAIANIFLNWLLIPRMYEYGAAAASVLSELIVMLVYLTFSHSYFHLTNNKVSIIKILTASVIMFVFLSIINHFGFNDLWGFVMKIIIGFFSYTISLFVLKENTICTFAKEKRLW